MEELEGLSRDFGRITLVAKDGKPLIDFENLSKNRIIKEVRKVCLFQCLKCSQAFDEYKELRTHLRKKKHFANLEEIRADEEEFNERLDGRRVEDCGPALKQTFQNLCVQRALLIRLKAC